MLSCFHYTKTIKCLLHLYKYESVFQYQRAVEALIVQYFRVDPFRLLVSWQKFLANKRVAFVPVPMTSRKKEERGFSPAYEFTIIFARLFAQKFSCDCKIFPALLVKNDDKGIQSRKKRQERLLSLQKTYSLNNPCVPIFLAYSPEVVVFVDDILTTGATTNVVIEQIAKNTELKTMLKSIPIIRQTFACA